MRKLKDERIIGFSIIGWAIIIFILCSLPGENIPNPNLDIPHLDKIIHFGMFFLLTFLMSIANALFSKVSFNRFCLITISITFFYGGFIEITQQYLFYRSGEILDLVADLLGGIVGTCCYPLIKYIKNRN